MAFYKSLKQFVDFMRRGRKKDIFDSEPERVWYKHLKRKLPDIVPQYRVRGYRVDFALPRQKIYFEIYGHRYHSSVIDMDRDTRRMRHLGFSGWQGWVFMAQEIMDDPKRCAVEAKRLVKING